MDTPYRWKRLPFHQCGHFHRNAEANPSPVDLQRGHPRALLEGEGAIGAVPAQLQSGHGGCESGWGGAVTGGWECDGGLVLGYGNAFGVESVQWEGGGGTSPPLQAIPWGTPPPASGHLRAQKPPLGRVPLLK